MNMLYATEATQQFGSYKLTSAAIIWISWRGRQQFFPYAEKYKLANISKPHLEILPIKRIFSDSETVFEEALL
jgi:hypothetical protein